MQIDKNPILWKEPSLGKGKIYEIPGLGFPDFLVPKIPFAPIRKSVKVHDATFQVRKKVLTIPLNFKGNLGIR